MYTANHKKFYKSRQHTLHVAVITKQTQALNTWYLKLKIKYTHTHTHTYIHTYIYGVFEILQIVQVM